MLPKARATSPKARATSPRLGRRCQSHGRRPRCSGDVVEANFLTEIFFTFRATLPRERRRPLTSRATLLRATSSREIYIYIY
ncbi:unnamed protein product, partial [Musa textilis]